MTIDIKFSRRMLKSRKARQWDRVAFGKAQWEQAYFVCEKFGEDIGLKQWNKFDHVTILHRETLNAILYLKHRVGDETQSPRFLADKLKSDLEAENPSRKFYWSSYHYGLFDLSNNRNTYPLHLSEFGNIAFLHSWSNSRFGSRDGKVHAMRENTGQCRVYLLEEKMSFKVREEYHDIPDWDCGIRSLSRIKRSK